MTACRYEFYLLVLKVSVRQPFASLTRERYLEHSKMKLVSPRDHVRNILYISFRVKFATL